MNYLFTLIPILISIAFATLFERKMLAAAQLRRGPNVVFWQGLLQPFADALKLVAKESVTPSKSDSIIFAQAPAIFLIAMLLSWL